MHYVGFSGRLPTIFIVLDPFREYSTGKMQEPRVPARKRLIGMIHLAALPGTARGTLSVAEIARRAAAEARMFREAGFDGVLIENMHDTPYLARVVGPEIIAAMTVAAGVVKAEFPGLTGIQILAGANEQAIAVAHACGLDFVRAEGFVFGHLADEGWLDACAGPLLRYRKTIGAEHVEIWADIKKKHSSHAVTADVSLVETAHAAAFFGANAVIVTGRVTGDAPIPSDFEGLRGAGLPVVIGSGVTVENLPAFSAVADVFIVGSSLKTGGIWSNELDPAAVEAMASVANALFS